MPDDPLLKLIRVRDAEPDKRWEEIPTPDETLEWMRGHLAVDARGLKPFAGVVVSAGIPQADERGKLWVKSSHPIALGTFVNGQWHMVYKYQPNTAFLWTQGENKLPKTEYLFVLSASEVAELGVPEIAADKKGLWVEFRPPQDAQISNV